MNTDDLLLHVDPLERLLQRRSAARRDLHSAAGGARRGRAAVSVVSASKAWNLAGLKCAAVVTASPAMASLAARFPPDTRWRIGHLGVIAAVAAYTEGE